MNQKKYLTSHSGIIHLLPLLLVGALIITGISWFMCLSVDGCGAEQVAKYLRSSETPLISQSPTSPESEEINTRDWKTYENGEFGFSFSYPISYTVDSEDGDTSFYILTDVQSPYDDNRNQNIFFSYREDLNYDETITSRASILENVEIEKLKDGLLLIGDGTGESSGMKFHIAIFDVNKKPAIFTTFFESEDHLRDFRDIVSTFNVEKVNQPDFILDTTGWNTYENGPFTLSYPTDWRVNTLSNDENFPIKERLSSFHKDRTIALSKQDLILIIGVQPINEAGSNGEILVSFVDFREFIENKIKIIKNDKTFYLNTEYLSKKQLIDSHGGVYSWASLSEILESDEFYRDREDIIQRGDYAYVFILVGEEEGVLTQEEVDELNTIIKTIKW